MESMFKVAVGNSGSYSFKPLKGPVSIYMQQAHDGTTTVGGSYALFRGSASYNAFTQEYEVTVGVGKKIGAFGNEINGFFGLIIDDDGISLGISGKVKISGNPPTGEFLSVSKSAELQLLEWDDIRDLFDKLGDDDGDKRPEGGGGLIDGPAGDYEDGREQQNRRLVDPIVLDLDGDGVELIARADSRVDFDMDGDGIKERTGWVGPDDALLAIDENGDGKISSIDELIGDLGRSGFEELATHDGNKDGVIDAKDAVYARLRVWKDVDSDGEVDRGEMRTLAKAGVKSIDLDFTTVTFTAEGNRIHEQSTFEWANGTTGLVVDAWFDVGNVSLVAAVGATGNAGVDALPDLPGYGDVAALRTAMLADGALATLVSDVVNRPLGNLAGVHASAEAALYRWAGVQDVSPTSRGEFFDGRKLAVLETFFGTPFDALNGPNPIAQAAEPLESAWNGLVEGFLARLLYAGAMGDVLAGSSAYSKAHDRFISQGGVDEEAAALIAAAPAAGGVAAAQYWAGAAPVLRQIARDAGFDLASDEYLAVENAALAPYGLSGFGDLLAGGVTPLAASAAPIEADGVFAGGAGRDTVYLAGDRQAVYGEGGDDRLSVIASSSSSDDAILLDGGAGDDTLLGGRGDDHLDGGSGADLLYGGSGDDTYVIDAVGDRIVESRNGGEDTVRSAVAIDLSRFTNVENAVLTGAAAVSLKGDALDNVLEGNDAANRIEGGAGDDTLIGGKGADTLIGGLGRDRYVLDSARDTVLETGRDEDTVVVGFSYTLGALIENGELTGTGNFRLTGNALDNDLTGNDGANILVSGAGRDTLRGGLGDDTYVVSAGNYSATVYEDEGGGVDLVQSYDNHDLSENVENLALLGSGDSAGWGNGLANTLTGNAGNNLLDGRGGADVMRGGKGDDTYVVDSAADVVTEAAGAGRDTVETTLARHTLGDNVEDLRLLPTSWGDAGRQDGTGNAGDNRIFGTDGVNILTGLAGDDELYGENGTDALNGGDGDDWLDGGLGRDKMTGGAGNDTYVVDNSKDQVIEAAGGGTDTVLSSLSYTLGAALEHLELTGYALNGTGNAAANRIIGNDGNNSLDGKAGADALRGGRGNDAYMVDDAGDVVIENEDEGEDHVASTVSFTLGAHVESLTLLGSAALSGAGNALANQLTGNAGANVLRGHDGDDILDGGAGADILYGGLGNDAYYVGSSKDRVIEEGDGEDTVYAAVSWKLGALIENGRLIGTGKLSLTGNALANELEGNFAANTLDGGAGADTMSGARGDDVYVVDDDGDRVYEDENAGVDTVRSSVSFDLGENVENLTLTGADDIEARGNELANILIGNGGDNRLDGRQGADRMSGGAGDDDYVVDNAGDVVTELASSGLDTVWSELRAYTLTDNVEQLVLYREWMTDDARDGTGNALANRIWGSGGANVIKGLAGDDELYGEDGVDRLEGGDGADWLDGGAGADSLIGGAGDDVYVVDDAGDRVTEVANQGADEVRSSISYRLGVSIERLTLTGFDDIDGLGNALANVVQGNGGDNVLDGGAGADILIGDEGDDTYLVDNVGDVVIEAPDAGLDEVRSTLSYELGVGVENLRLQGTKALAGTGNELDNAIFGNAGANRLTGGLGSDVLTGAGGADVFVWRDLAEFGDWDGDEITDFNRAQKDKIDLSGLDAIARTTRNDAFSFIAESAFTKAGQVRFEAYGDGLRVELNLDADLSADASFILRGVTSLASTDLLL